MSYHIDTDTTYERQLARQKLRFEILRETILFVRLSEHVTARDYDSEHVLGEAQKYYDWVIRD